jgi:hypothetical protein
VYNVNSRGKKGSKKETSQQEQPRGKGATHIKENNMALQTATLIMLGILLGIAVIGARNKLWRNQ